MELLELDAGGGRETEILFGMALMWYILKQTE